MQINGNFLPTLDKLEQNARDAYITAKREEIKRTSEQDIYMKFEEAYDKYKKVSDFLEQSGDAILFASNHSKTNNRINVISIIVTVVSIIIAIISFIM